ncbi:MAG: hypothetical protein CMH83_02300 [Nocardioides sp.]|nr:hypothetical protein [Nocardioides sp.]
MNAPSDPRRRRAPEPDAQAPEQHLVSVDGPSPEPRAASDTPPGDAGPGDTTGSTGTATAPSRPGSSVAGRRSGRGGPGDGTPTTSRLRLFVAGSTPRAARAVDAVQDLVRMLGPGMLVEVVDVLERPDLAEQFGVVATPLLVREEPRPIRRVVGDLSDSTRLAQALDVTVPPEHDDHPTQQEDDR